jgi:hypothetical protein
MASFGGSKPNIPEVKGVGQLTQEATSANISALPQIIEALKTYGPRYASAILESNPQLKQLSDLISGRLTDASKGNIPDYIRNPFLANLHAAQASRGFADSPVSALTESIGLGGLTEESIQNTINDSLKFNEIPGTTVNSKTLGLELPSIGTQEGTGQEQNVSDINRASSLYELNQSNKKKSGTQLASLIGAGTGAAIGLSGGPIGAIQGAQIGGTLGNTFF